MRAFLHPILYSILRSIRPDEHAYKLNLGLRVPVSVKKTRIFDAFYLVRVIYLLIMHIYSEDGHVNTVNSILYVFCINAIDTQILLVLIFTCSLTNCLTRVWLISSFGVFDIKLAIALSTRRICIIDNLHA